MAKAFPVVDLLKKARRGARIISSESRNDRKGTRAECLCLQKRREEEKEEKKRKESKKMSHLSASSAKFTKSKKKSKVTEVEGLSKK